MFLYIVRLFYVLVVLGFAYAYATTPSVPLTEAGPVASAAKPAGSSAAVGSTSATYVTLMILLPLLGAIGLVVLDMFWKNKRLQIISGLFFGILAGLIVAYVLSNIVDLLASAWVEPAGASTVASAALAMPVVGLIKAFLAASAVYFCVSFVLQTKDDFRFVIPYVEFSKQTKGARPLLLDTSVIIDGRIADIAETKILDSELIVPRFVLTELQAIADSDDKLKRNRGRRGLDILNRLQSIDKIGVQILDAHVTAVDEVGDVDNKLVALAKHLDGRVVTNDYNLNKIAQLRGVDVININDLSNALKPIMLPGESMTVKIIKPGEEFGQGVGYLEDGTMIVAEGGRDHIGKDVNITVTSVLQTSAGRMIFGRTDSAPPPRRRM
ncbi:MAG: PIN/TRAM domain-containing protein [Phycisphaerae bacterium]|nr:PIN/TRAM domain-containing protein [Phycisphaerae bacterium]